MKEVPAVEKRETENLVGIVGIGETGDPAEIEKGKFSIAISCYDN